MEDRIIVQVPGLSKSLLSDLMGGIRFRDQRFKVVEPRPDAKLNMDPATIALVSTVAGAVGTEFVKVAVSSFFDWLRNRNKKPEPPKVQVTILMTLGGKQTFVVSDLADLDPALAGVPADPAEIAQLTLREEA